MSRGVEAAIGEYHRLQAEEPDDWDFSKHQLNSEQYPESSNVWDSLPESYMKRGDIESAIDNYERRSNSTRGTKALCRS